MSDSATGGVTERELRRRKRVEVTIANPVLFGEYYMRPYSQEWNQPLPKIAHEMLAFASRVRKGVLMTPPEFLKTTMVSQLYPLFLTYRYAALGKLGNLLGMLLSEEQDLAERNLAVVAWHIEHNPRLAADFIDAQGRVLVEPDPDEDKWTDDTLIVRRPGVSKDPTWSAKGLRSKGIQGKRLRHLIGDDVVTPASARSPAIQKEAKRLWDEQVTSRVLPDGQSIIAGNFNHSHDLLSELSTRPSWAVMRRPALHKPGKPSEPPDGARDASAVPALPERWPRSRLLRELADKPARFDSMYLLRAGDAKGRALRSEWVTRIAMEDIERLDRIYLLSIDGAPGAAVDPDPSFFTITAGILTPEHLDIVESFAARGDTTRQVEMLAAFVGKYSLRGHVGGIGLAKIALDRYFGGAALVGFPELRPLLHEHSLPEGSKTTRLEHLGPYFKHGWARVLDSAWIEKTADPDDANDEESLAEQWVALPNQRHDDRLDGVDVLIREATDRLGAGRFSQVVAAGPGGNPAPTDGILQRVW